MEGINRNGRSRNRNKGMEELMIGRKGAAMEGPVAVKIWRDA